MFSRGYIRTITIYYGLIRLNMISLEGLGMILAEPSVIEVFMFGPGSTHGAKDALMYDHVGTPCRAVSDDKSPQLVRVHMHACRFARWAKRTTPCRHRKLFDLLVTLLSDTIRFAAAAFGFSSSNL